MKRLVIAAGLIVLSSCSSMKDRYKLKSTEFYSTPYQVLVDGVYKENKKVASLQSVEWELTPKGKFTPEMSFSVEDHSNYADIIGITRFLHTKYPKYKIELNLDKVASWKLAKQLNKY